MAIHGFITEVCFGIPYVLPMHLSALPLTMFRHGLPWRRNNRFSRCLRALLACAMLACPCLALAEDPFGDGKGHDSPLVGDGGSTPFAQIQTQSNSPDLHPPTVEVGFPAQGARISSGGFRLYGTAEDDVAVKGVRLRLTLPSGAVVERQAAYRAESGIWQVDTGSFTGEAAGLVQVAVQAADPSLNVAEAHLTLSLINDGPPPGIEMLSHKEGDRVPTGGFLVSGRVTDDTLMPILTARVMGGGLPAAEERRIQVAPSSGRWSVMIAADGAFSTLPMTLTLTATDGAGNVSQQVVHLYPTDDDRQAWHVLQRTTFGAAPGQVTELVKNGVRNFLRRQLQPDSVGDTAFEQRQTGWLDTGGYVATDLLRHAVYSRRQLREVMAWFWDNHFSTDYGRHKRAEYEQQEHEAFLDHALGRFRDLLGISAKSPAMLITLDGVNNKKGAANENYARELMELHTLGIAGGYTQQEVVEVARAFTGWTVKERQFLFDPGQHDTGEKHVLGDTLPTGHGMEDGEAVLDRLARHPSTARHICAKLVTLFVDDQPVESLEQKCTAEFLAQAEAPDQMVRVLWTILGSTEFLGAEHRGRKLKTPLEFLVGAARNLGLETEGDDLALEMKRLGMDPYSCPVPTGYDETGDAWISSGQLLARVSFLDRLLSSNTAAGASQVNLLGQMQAAGLETAEGVAGRMLEMALGPTTTRGLRDWAVDVLTEGGVYPYFSWASDAETRLRRLGKAILGLPEYQIQ